MHEKLLDLEKADCWLPLSDTGVKTIVYPKAREYVSEKKVIIKQ